ncbi:50S ribosomal protein L29 [Blattabacterium cuenoti]|uniref:50S ribosomal protein L29 n=1 Tax=Blattabacterium cuenoti TaxID=1653831 RepID=UPI00163C3FFB|nr:50S ribosomal protein L29 [Blattabacterium cuenoti]
MKKDTTLKKLTIENIQDYLIKKKNFYQKIIFDHTFGLKKNPIEIRFLRKNIAQLKTELNIRKK